MCEQMYAQSSKPSKSCKNNRDDAAAPRLDVDTLHVLAHAKSVRALTLAVGGSHWIVSKWVRGYSTVSSVASAIVVSSTQFALKTATVRVAARYQRLHVRHLWVQENNRLKTLDETLLRRKRAELRQEYRKHKKRGRPGRIEMKNAKHQLDLIKMDIEGSEKQVFEGDTVKAWLPQVRVFLAELHPDMREGSDVAVRAHLRNDEYMEVTQGEYEVYVRKKKDT